MYVEETDVAVTPDDEKSDVELALEESDTQEGSSPEETDDQETAGEAEKTEGETERSEETEPDDEELPEGQAVPYNRFSKVNLQKKEFMTKAEQAEARVKQYEEAFNNAEVLGAYLKSQGMTDEKIAETLESRGLLKGKNETPDKLAEGLDLTKTEGWTKFIERIVESKLTPIQQAQRQRDMQTQISRWEKEAETLAKDRYNIDYSVARKEMEKYLSIHPEDAGLGHPKILALAMSESAYKAGEKRGIESEKTRTKNLKASAIEGDGLSTTVGEGEPGADASISELMAYARDHIK